MGTIYKTSRALPTSNSDVWTYADWAEEQGLKAQDTGIDLVVKTHTGELHAVQCKLYAEDYRLQKADIDSFFTASGKKTFSRRIIVSTTDNWSGPDEDALLDQHPPVTIDGPSSSVDKRLLAAVFNLRNPV